MIKAAVVGITGFGATHYRDLMQEYKKGRVQPVAAVVINPDEAADRVAELKAIGCDILPDFDSLISKYAGQIDICCIPTGIAMHKTMSVAAVEAGFNVFVEKPVAATFAEVKEMDAAAKRTGKFIAVGYQNMYQPETFRVKEILCSGIIGKAQQLKCYAVWPRHFEYYNRNNWAARIIGRNGEPVLDSPFTNALAHDLNLQLYFAGPSLNEMVKPASVQSVLYRANDVQSCDTASIRVTTECGKEIIFTITHAGNCSLHPTHIIKCEKGELHFNRCVKIGTVFNDKGEEIDHISFTELAVDQRANIWDALIDRINGKDAFICDVKMAGVHTLVSNAAFDSTPVRVFPSDIVSQVTFDETGIRRTVVTGIEKALRSSFDAGRLLNKEDMPFIEAGEIIDLAGYTSFENRFGYTDK